MDKLFHWISHTNYYHVGIAVAIIVIFFVISQLFTRYFLKLMTKIATKTKSRVDDAIVNSFQKPVELFLTSTGFYLGLTYLSLPGSWIHLITEFYRTLIIIFIGWGFFLFSNAIGLFFNHIGNRLNIRFEKIVIPFLTKMIKFIVVVLTISIIAAEWGYHVSGLVAGLGLGGLAIALAAKDTLSNLIGGLVIITETPFTIDDWIKTPSVEGTVEDISFRSTKIRTFEQAIVTVPNSTLANEPITNWSKMGKRRIFFNLQLDIHTPKEKLLSCTEAIRDMLKKSEDIDPDLIYVHFYQFSTSSLDLQLYFFTKTTFYNEWLDVKETVNAEILGILENHNIRLGVPVQQTYYDVAVPQPEQIEKMTDEQAELKKERDR